MYKRRGRKSGSIFAAFDSYYLESFLGMDVSVQKIFDFYASFFISRQRLDNLSDLVFGAIDTILQFDDIEVLIGCQPSFAPVVELVAWRFNFAH